MGGHTVNFKMNFSIHERIGTLSQWTHQLLMPDGIHIYCKSIKEAKELAEIAARRIFVSFKKQFPSIKAKRNNVKDKAIKLSDALLKRGINGFTRIWFSKIKHMGGWMFAFDGNEPQLLGPNYKEALEFINSGSLDFYKGA